MGSKTGARALMAAAGVPIVPGATEPVPDVDAAAPDRRGDRLPGGGEGRRGRRRQGVPGGAVTAHLEDAFGGAPRGGAVLRRRAVYLERYLPEPRHVEIQVLADGHGNAIHLGERDCSVQRRHQKLVEETPSPVVSDDLRAPHGRGVGAGARAVGYRRRGTLEYLVSGEEFFFLEMNTRIQVEHTITEEVTGIDLVREQVRVAAGERLSVAQDGVAPRGHAIECRINAEDASRRFLPSPALITAYREPSGPGVRVDSGVRAGSAIPEIYDPMIAKLVVWDVDREAARRRMIRALGEYVVEGPVDAHPLPPLPAGAGGVHRRRRLPRAARADGRGADADPGGAEPAPRCRPTRPMRSRLAERRFTAEVGGAASRWRSATPRARRRGEPPRPPRGPEEAQGAGAAAAPAATARRPRSSRPRCRARCCACSWRSARRSRPATWSASSRR